MYITYNLLVIGNFLRYNTTILVIPEALKPLVLTFH